MCGVIGVSLKDVSEADLELVREVFRQSMIRGKHATGVAFVENTFVHTIKEPIDVVAFLEIHDPSEWVDEDGFVC